MKRLFILIAACMIGMVLPQGMWAETYSGNGVEIVVNGKTVTVNSTKAGALSTYLNSGNASAAIAAIQAANGDGSSIVFDGKFNSDDLSKLNENNCCVQKKVDMAEAKFIKSGSSGGGSSYPYLYHSEEVMNNNTSGKNEGDRCITCGKKYTSGSSDGQNFNWIDQTGQNNDYTDNNQLNSLGGNDPQWYSTLEEAGPAQYNDYSTAILVGGKEYVFHNGSWVEDSQSGGDDDEYDYTQMKFSYWGTNIEEAITSNYVGATDPLSSTFLTGCSNLTSLTLGSGAFTFKIGNANEFTKLTTIEVKKGVVQLGALYADNGDGFFPNSSSLSTLTFEMGGTTPLILGTQCFNGCTNIASVSFPARTQLIETMAFGGTSETSILSEVRFNNEVSVDYPMVIKSQAFENQKKITDVWVDIDPDVRPLVCEYEAFDFDAMDGQTYPANPMAVLHFNEDYWDYYAGDWKRGMTLTHEDLLTIRNGEGAVDGESITKGTSSQLVNGTTAILGSQSNDLLKTGQIKDKQPANGWQQFAKTSTGIDIVVPKGKFYRTYSTPSALVKPDWMKIYRVKQFDDGFKENSNASSADEANAATKQASTEELTPTVTGSDNKTYIVIPENTGVIRVDVREKEAIYYFLELERTSAANAYTENASSLEYPYSETGDKVNYMYPTKGDEVTIGPTEKSGNTITYRIFGLLKTTTSGVVPQFSRAKVGTKLGDHRAYLRLPADVFHWRDEKNGSSQDATGNDVVVDTRANAYSKISLFFDEDIEELGGGIATAIINSIEEDMYKNDSFYTLQGVKVAKPTTKGVYIHNGKKILIK